MARSIWRLLGLLFLIVPLTLAPAFADDDKLKKEELDQLLAPIALYPDDLLTNVLMASTYPLDVVQAARWRADGANAKLKGDALTKALESQSWDPSVKALVQFPDVLKMMNDKLDWTQKLGDAFLAQQDDVMDEIQFLRQKADEAGNLKSNKQQKVVRETNDSAQPIYIIEQASPDTVYVPVYQPTVVYGAWPYPSYPPYYWPYPGATFVNGFFWGTGVAVAAGIWGWNNFDWRHHDIDIDVNKWNNINIDRDKIANKEWKHRPNQRGSVPYRNKDVRDKFSQADRGKLGNNDFRGRDNIDRSKIDSKLKDSDHAAIKDKIGDGAGAKLKDSDRAAIKDKIGDGAGAKIKDKAGSRDLSKVSKGDIARKAAKIDRPSPGAFDVKRGADVRKASNRGHASREASRSRPNVSRGGGSRAAGRGGGGHRGGGRRSDLRVKHDVVLLGRFDNGLGFYRFAYNGSEKLYVGVIAQEVLKVMPQAVSQDGEGYLRVEYDTLGVPFQTYDHWLESGARIPTPSPHY